MAVINGFKLGVHPVIDGVVARGKDKYSIAIKKTSGNILLDTGKIKPSANVIFIRAFSSLIEKAKLIFSTFNYSADYFDNEVQNDSDTEILTKTELSQKQDRIKNKNIEGWAGFLGSLLLMIIFVLGFFILPVFISSAFFDNVRDENWIWFNVIECVTRLLIMLVGFVIIKFMGGTIGRLKKYACAANRALNCYENKYELTFDNVRISENFHPRSMAFLVFLSVVIFSVVLIFIKMESLLLAFLIRLLILLVSISVAYEITMLFGRFNGKTSRIVAMIFGMWVEKFTLAEPDDMSIYVAITAINNAITED